MSHFWQDVRYSFRLLRRRPLFTAFAVLATGLGIGFTVAVFSIANAVLLHGLPVAEEDRLVMLWEQDLASDRDRITLSPLELRAYQQAGSAVFEDVAGVEPASFTLLGRDLPAEVDGARASVNLFALLGVRPELGRLFRPEEERPGRGGAALLSYSFWQSHFGADRGVLGRTLLLETSLTAAHPATRQAAAEAFTVVGVLPPGLDLPLYANVDVWTPTAAAAGELPRHQGGVRALGRLRRGVTATQAAAAVAPIARHLAQEDPERLRNVSMALIPLREEESGWLRPKILSLLAGVAMLLLIVCANIANLLLGRVEERRQEVAVRRALGAGSRRLLRQLLTESGVLGLLGTALGLLFAVTGTRLFVLFGPSRIPRWQQIRVDGPALGVALATALLTVLLFGIMPALQAARPDLQDVLRRRGGDAGSSGNRARRLLVAAEIALAFLVCTSAGVMAKSALAMQRLDLGFDPRHVLTARISPARARYAERERRAAFFQSLLEQVRALPGVTAAGGINIPPLMDANLFVPVAIEGRADPQHLPVVRLRGVTPGLFGGLGMRVLAGRDFVAADLGDLGDLHHGAVVVSRSMARDLWPGRSPLGARVRLMLPDRPTPLVPVVGVVDDVRQWLDGLPAPTVYLASYSQSAMTLAIRTAADPAALAGPLRRLVFAIDPSQPVFDLMTMDRRMTTSSTLVQGRFNAGLMVAFAVAALALGGLGIYAVAAYAVVRRRHELGVRMALGARRGQVQGMILAEGLRLFAAGIAAGGLASLAATRMLASFLFGVTASQPLLALEILAVLAAITGAALWLPAARASAVDPAVALRHE
ncbi:MAG TPA: ABC transporter permease [Thermoanaerobaculia bacterium]|nr:ABC transporter permease [Thermoanaerobaculia bacterium]